MPKDIIKKGGYYPDKETDDILSELEKRIREEYSRAEKYVEHEANNYFAKFKERFIHEYDAYQQGKYTDQEFINWYYTQVGRGEGWETLRDKLAQRVCDSNKVASSYINDTTPGIWSLNYNYENYVFEKNYDFANFELWDEQTVRRLIANDEIKLPQTKPNYAKDYLWNQKKMNSALISNILMGKGIDSLAKSFELVTNMNRSAAIRNARTAVTGAQNAGRMASYVQAEAMGITVEKEWIATLDDRTRISHQELDGERVKYDEPFHNGLLYPGDMNGDPSELYNCRCTMRAIMPNINDSRDVQRIAREPSEIDPLTGEPIKGQNTYHEGMTYTGRDGTVSYEDWVDLKERERAADSEDIPEEWDDKSEPERTPMIEGSEQLAIEEKTVENKPKTKEESIQQLKDSLWDSHVNHIVDNNLNLVTDESIKNEQIIVNIDKLDEKSAEAFSDVITQLTQEYDSGIKEIKTMSKMDCLQYRNTYARTYHHYETDYSTMEINPIKCGDAERLENKIRELVEARYAAQIEEGKELEYIATHEFAHTLIDNGSKLNWKRNWAEADYDMIEEFRAEWNPIYEEYIQAYTDIDQRAKDAEFLAITSFEGDAWEKAQELARQRDEIKISTYSLESADEFLAESFVAVKLGNSKNEYALKMMELVDKYFKRR